MQRENMVRVSDSEKAALEELREVQFDANTPLGGIIGALANGELIAEEKQILVTGIGKQAGYGDGRISSPRVDIVCRPIGDGGEGIRGLSPDLVILLTEIPEDIRQDILSPTGAQVLELY